ncbi:hypothetical protein AGMMS49982_09010 [Bacteroidia bacterium]|nr:hypothetical protein AGMMS49982_09010 [Bacteroidia bacterium]
MAIISCPECGKQVSDKAEECPHCGGPIKSMFSCPECGEQLFERAEECPRCGCPLDMDVDGEDADDADDADDDWNKLLDWLENHKKQVGIWLLILVTIAAIVWFIPSLWDNDNRLSEPPVVEVVVEEVTGLNNSINMLIANDKTYFYEQPDWATIRKKNWLAKGDKAIIEKTENGFGYVEFINSKGRTTKGWIPLSQTKVEKADSEVINKIALKKISFADNECSYYIASGRNEQLVRNIEQARITAMEGWYGSTKSDDPAGWTLARKEAITEAYGDDDYSQMSWSTNSYQNSRVFSIGYSYRLCGGIGVGIVGETLFTFDKTTGKQISIEDLVIDNNKLLILIEKQLRKENNIPDGADLSEYGYNEGPLPLPDFEFTTKGIRFHYGAYVLGDGPAAEWGWGHAFIIPYSKLKGIVRYIEDAE